MIDSSLLTLNKLRLSGYDQLGVHMILSSTSTNLLQAHASPPLVFQAKHYLCLFVALILCHLRTKEDEEEYVSPNGTEKDPYDLSVVVPLLASLRGRKREALADGSFDGRGGGRGEITELVCNAVHKSAERRRAELDQVDGHRTPDASHEELLEEGARDQRVVANKDVCRHESAAEYASGQHGESSPEEGAEITREGATTEGPDLSDYCDDRSQRRRIADLALQVCRIEVLTAV